LELRDSAGKLVSDNFYWMGGASPDYRKLNRLGEAQIKASARTAADGDEGRVKVVFGKWLKARQRLNEIDAFGGGLEKTRVLPAYYSDNYVSLLPGEKKEIVVEFSKAVLKNGVSIGLRGWNLEPRVVKAGVEK